MHLAELNIARLKYPFDDPRVAEFADNLDLINGIAERSPGFVWRLKDENGNATDIRAFDDPLVIVNMSVWRDAESLEHFVWNTVHRQFYERRAEWFEVLGERHLVMWWVPEGHRPTLEEALARLAHMQGQGDSEHAFGWAFAKEARLWRERACGAVAAE